MKHHATPTHPHLGPDSDLRDDPTMQQLQTLWDGLDRQVNLALARCAARPLLSAAAFRAALRRHRRQVALQWLITLCNLLVVPVGGILLSRYTTFCPEAKTAILLLLPFILFNIADSLCALLLTSRIRRPAPPLSHTLRTATIALLLLVPYTSYGQLGDGLAITQSDRNHLLKATLYPGHRPRAHSIYRTGGGPQGLPSLIPHPFYHTATPLTPATAEEHLCNERKHGGQRADLPLFRTGLTGGVQQQEYATGAMWRQQASQKGIILLTSNIFQRHIPK